MKDIIDNFGYNAGLIWKELNKNGPLNRNKIIQKTKLNEQEFYGAVGWLARENKIFKNGPVYRIGQTNLTDKIGKDAGKIWDALKTWNEIDESYISKFAGINRYEMYLGLGWLAKEGKLCAKIVKPKKRQIKYKLKK